MTPLASCDTNTSINGIKWAIRQFVVLYRMVLLSQSLLWMYVMIHSHTVVLDDL